MHFFTLECSCDCTKLHCHFGTARHTSAEPTHFRNTFRALLCKRAAQVFQLFLLQNILHLILRASVVPLIELEAVPQHLLSGRGSPTLGLARVGLARVVLAVHLQAAVVFGECPVGWLFRFPPSHDTTAAVQEKPCGGCCKWQAHTPQSSLSVQGIAFTICTRSFSHAVPPVSMERRPWGNWHLPFPIRGHSLSTSILRQPQGTLGYQAFRRRTSSETWD